MPNCGVERLAFCTTASEERGHIAVIGHREVAGGVGLEDRHCGVRYVVDEQRSSFVHLTLRPPTSLARRSCRYNAALSQAHPMFANPETPLETLPSAEVVNWQALHPKFARRLQAGRLISWSVVAVIAGIAHWLAYVVPDGPLPMSWAFGLGWAVLAALAGTAVAWPIIAVPRQGYALRDKDILYKSGVLWRVVKAVPYDRVQHAETGSAPLDRRFGLARLTVYTAGGAGGDLGIHGLDAAAAERMRAYIVGKLEHRQRHDCPRDFPRSEPGTDAHGEL